MKPVIFDTNISEYTVVFTYSQFHSMKLLTESFPFTANSTFLYTSKSNSNILGLRSFAEKKKAKIQKVELDKEICYDLFNEISLYQNKVLWKLMESNNYKKLIIITKSF